MCVTHTVLPPKRSRCPIQRCLRKNNQFSGVNETFCPICGQIACILEDQLGGERRRRRLPRIRSLFTRWNFGYSIRDLKHCYFFTLNTAYIYIHIYVYIYFYFLPLITLKYCNSPSTPKINGTRRHITHGFAGDLPAAQMVFGGSHGEARRPGRAPQEQHEESGVGGASQGCKQLTQADPCFPKI
jgi:hypothetical protein